MEPSRDDPWRASQEMINARAWWYLDHCSGLPPSVSHGKPFHGLPRLRLWDDAMGFCCETEPTTLTVYELFADDYRREPVVREAIWQRSGDLDRVREEVGRSGRLVVCKPTILVRDAAVPADHLAALLAEAAVFRVPLTWSSDTESVTSDVGGQEVEIFSQDQPPAVVSLEWSHDTPPVWEPVLKWGGRLREFLEDCLCGNASSA